MGWLGKIMFYNSVHNYYYNLDFLNVKMTCFGPSQQAFFRPKCKTLARLEAPTSYRTQGRIKTQAN